MVAHGSKLSASGGKKGHFENVTLRALPQGRGFTQAT